MIKRTTSKSYNKNFLVEPFWKIPPVPSSFNEQFDPKVWGSLVVHVNFHTDAFRLEIPLPLLT